MEVRERNGRGRKGWEDEVYEVMEFEFYVAATHLQGGWLSMGEVLLTWVTDNRITHLQTSRVTRGRF